MPTRIYRIEREDGVGVFEAGLVYTYRQGTGYDGHDPYSMPRPLDDPGLQAEWSKLRQGPNGKAAYAYQAYYFGFTTLEQLVTWFPASEGRAKMAKEGAKLRVYEAEDVLIGLHQIVFKRSEAALVAELDLVNFQPRDELPSQLGDESHDRHEPRPEVQPVRSVRDWGRDKQERKYIRGVFADGTDTIQEAPGMLEWKGRKLVPDPAGGFRAVSPPASLDRWTRGYNGPWQAGADTGRPQAGSH